MKTLAVAASKGGSGKTTIASALAARASKEGLRVAMMDLNADQGNLTQWWMLRGQPMNPRLILDIENVPEDVKMLEAAKFDWLIIDTPPAEMDLIEQAAMTNATSSATSTPGWYLV
jgi:chromosome partitioning protein